MNKNNNWDSFSYWLIWKLWENYLRYQCSKLWIWYFQWEEWNSTDAILKIWWKIYKIQVKTTIQWIKNWCLKFNTCKKDKSWKRIVYTQDDIDYFVFFDAINEQLYLLDFESTPKYEITIRIDKWKNNQKKWIIFWENITFESQIQKLL